MRGLLVFDILNHLYERDAVNEDQIDITDFINEIKKNSGDRIELHNVNRLNKAISLIHDRQYAYINFAKNGEPAPILAADTDRVQASLSLWGYDYVVDERRKKDSDELNKAIKENTFFQKISGIITLLFTGALVAIGVISVVVLLTRPQQNSLQLSPRTEQLLDRTLKLQIEIDSLLLLKEAESPSKRK